MTWLDGSKKFLVTVAALGGLTVFCTWGGLPPEQATSTWTIGLPVILGTWGAGEAYSKHLKKNGKEKVE